MCRSDTIVEMNGISVQDAVLVSILAVFCLEHIGRRQDISVLRPSFYLGGLVSVIRRIVRGVATLYAHVAIFPAVIELWEIYKTTKALLKPVFDLLNIPFDWHNAAVATAERWASVDHMRSGTLFLFVFGWVWYNNLVREFYLVVGGGIICLMILIHIVTLSAKPEKASTPPPPGTPPPIPQTPPPTAPLGSPPPRPRKPKGRGARITDIVPHQGD